MNLRTILLSVGVTAASVTSASAVELVGSSIALEYSAFTEDSSFAATSAKGSVELGFNKNFSLQGDLGGYKLNLVDETGSNIGLHGIYHVNETTSLGAFVSSDSIAGENTQYLGLEAGFGRDGFGLEGYAGKTDFEGVDATIYGLLGHYTFGNNVGLGASVDAVDFDIAGLSMSRYGFQLDYKASENTLIYAEIGSLSAEIDDFGLSDSEQYVGIGIEFNIGSTRGTTFGDRGLLRLIPGL